MTTATPSKWTLREFRQHFSAHRLIALDGHSGKTLFDTMFNKKEYIQKFNDAEVLSAWVDLTCTKNSGFAPMKAEPVMMCFLSHNSWKGENDGN